MQISLGEETSIDLDKDNQGELSAFVSDLTKNEPIKGAVVRFETILPRPAREAEAPQAQVSQPQVQAGLPAQALPASDPTVLETNKPQALVEAKSSPYPFTMNVTFRGYCMFRYEIDRRDRDERYYHKSEQISVSANNTIKIWLSNASACVVQIVAGGKATNLELGVPGEVAVKQIKWVQSDSGGYALGAYSVN
jgi:cytoskeleton protein RodZ